LKADKKELAEHMMLVDLARNDLGRVCDFGSVRVHELAQVHRFSHVMHMVSDVRGRLSREKSAADALAASFPAGTVSGAPKVRALEIILENEPVSRDFYSGAAGFLGRDGDSEFCIMLRTAVWRDGELAYQAGAGIVADSVPEREFAETEHKAAAIERALLLLESER
jgi:anthranilate synthase component 1